LATQLYRKTLALRYFGESSKESESRLLIKRFENAQRGYARRPYNAYGISNRSRQVENQVGCV